MAPKKASKAEPVKRAPTAYQIFMKEEMARLKAVDPDQVHKERFSTAAKNWSANKK
tara:strand:+ start:232 stop:399 length:168 start_codon:yes stop_codon:yes gene_type:complete